MWWLRHLPPFYTSLNKLFIYSIYLLLTDLVNLFLMLNSVLICQCYKQKADLISEHSIILEYQI
jgi:hypothetical protein